MSTTATRVRNTATQMRARADWLDKQAANTPNLAGDLIHAWAQDLRKYARWTMGDIGEEQEEIEVLPLTEPVTIPETAPAPSQPVPA
jgi:hypothetical protein